MLRFFRTIFCLLLITVIFSPSALCQTQAPVIEWQKCYGGNSGDGASCIQPTKDGGYIIAGTASSTEGEITNSHGYDDCWIIKIDSKGNIQWQKCYGGSGYDRASAIQSQNNNEL
jgi:hypothetical protein